MIRNESQKAKPEEWEVVKALVAHLKNQQESGNFIDPVEWKNLGLADYPRVIKRPMCLNDVEKKLEKGEYQSTKEAAEDIQLIWDNCRTYNRKGSVRNI
jgi:hypothetical protein